MNKILLALAIAVPALFAAELVHAKDYSMDGYGDNGYYYGDIESTSGSRDVEGYVYDEDGNEHYFEGEWSGHGEVEGYTDEGDYIYFD